MTLKRVSESASGTSGRHATVPVAQPWRASVVVSVESSATNRNGGCSDALFPPHEIEKVTEPGGPERDTNGPVRGAQEACARSSSILQRIGGALIVELALNGGTPWVRPRRSCQTTIGLNLSVCIRSVVKPWRSQIRRSTRAVK
jgi:hypothetical protein